MTEQQRAARKLALQRQRRQAGKRIDYHPSEQVLALITPELRPYVGGDYSSVIDRLISKAAGAAPEFPPASRRCAPAINLDGSTAGAGIGRQLHTGAPAINLGAATNSAAIAGIIRAGATESDESADKARIAPPVRTSASDFEGLPAWAPGYLALGEARDAAKRVPCGGRRRSDGQPCEALSVPGKRRCKWHGGYSTGPRKAEGKARVTANLRNRR